MQKYIEQLVDDLHEAAQNPPQPGELWDSVDMNNDAEVDDIAYVEQYFYGPMQKLSEIVGIEKVQFPPTERIPGEYLKMLLDEMISLLEVYHFVPDFPEGLPDDLTYRILYDHWDSEQTYVGAGATHMEFCTYDPPSCPFPAEYCYCRQFDAEEDNENIYSSDDQGDELPF